MDLRHSLTIANLLFSRRIEPARTRVVWQMLQTPNVAPRRAGSRHHSDNAKRAFGVLPGKTYGPRAFSEPYRPYGQRERDRRLAQIQRGQLKAENGLVS